MSEPLVLVPLDGSKQALCALPIARALADLEKATVRILHVTEANGPPGKTAQSLGLAPADLRGGALEVRSGRPGEAILAAATELEASLIVMCPHSAEVQPAGALGATAQAVLRGAQCPVVLVNPHRAPAGGWALRRVLAPHDGSPAVSKALKPATELARKAGAELIVMQVAGDKRAVEAGSIAPPAYLDQFQHSWPAWSAEFLQRLDSISSLADLRVSLLMRHGEAAQETIRAAGEGSADLIVLAWKGSWEATRASTVKAVLPDAPCPILVARLPDA